MTTLFKQPTEREQHWNGCLDSYFAINKFAKITRKQLGQLSRKVTDSLGILNATIPGYDMTTVMEKYAVTNGLSVSYKNSKTGKKLNFTIG
jgi:hypothetical protein